MATEYFNDAWRIPNNKNQSLVSNYSMEFNGTSDFVNCGNDSSLQITGAMTVSYWFKGQGGSNIAGGVGKLSGNGSRGFLLGMTSSGTIYFYIAPTASSLLLAAYSHTPDTNWHHLVGVFTPSTSLELYLDGQLVDTTSTSTSSQYNASNNLQIGARGDSTAFFNGLIDQVCIFDYALPATGTNSVATLYGNGTAVTNPMSLSPKPISYYQLGDQSVYNGANYLVPNNSLQDYVFDFDGSNDYINFINGSTMARGQEITYSVWANLDTFSADIIGNKGSSNFGTGLNFAAGNLVFQLGDGSNDSYNNSRITLSNYVNTNEWFHIIGTFDGTNAKIYINGIERNNWTPTQPFTISGWNNNFQIGKRADQVSSFINGRLSNVAFWNSGLTPTQVTTLYNNGSPNDISSLSPISWYKLNAQDTFDGTNWTIKDYGSGSNDGTSSGMTSANLITSDLQHTSGYSPYALDLDGINDYLDCGDSNTFTFGNGTTDSPFSISAWINMDDATRFRVVSKAGSNGNEYFLTNGGDDKLNFILYDTSGVGDIRAKYDTALTSYQGQWIHVVGTYSGVNRQNGIELYLNGSLLTTLKVLNSPYTAMNNTTQPFEIGRSASSSYANGKVSNVSVF